MLQTLLSPLRLHRDETQGVTFRTYDACHGRSLRFLFSSPSRGLHSPRSIRRTEVWRTCEWISVLTVPIVYIFTPSERQIKNNRRFSFTFGKVNWSFNFFRRSRILKIISQSDYINERLDTISSTLFTSVSCHRAGIGDHNRVVGTNESKA